VRSQGANSFDAAEPDAVEAQYFTGSRSHDHGPQRGGHVFVVLEDLNLKAMTV
jgi:hypothetical protein